MVGDKPATVIVADKPVAENFSIDSLHFHPKAHYTSNKYLSYRDYLLHMTHKILTLACPPFKCTVQLLINIDYHSNKTIFYNIKPILVNDQTSLSLTIHASPSSSISCRLSHSVFCSFVFNFLYFFSNSSINCFFSSGVFTTIM